jgi:hypothetical protein
MSIARIEPLVAVESGEPDGAETGAEAMLGVGALIEDQVAQRRGGGADEAMRDAVIMRLDLDVIVDADPADPPLSQHVRASGKA